MDNQYKPSLQIIYNRENGKIISAKIVEKFYSIDVNSQYQLNTRIINFYVGKVVHAKDELISHRNELSDRDYKTLILMLETRGFAIKLRNNKYISYELPNYTKPTLNKVFTSQKKLLEAVSELESAWENFYSQDNVKKLVKN